MEYMIVNGELCHHGIKGQKWGIRRFQNEDGSLTNVGKKRYLKEVEKDMDSHFKSKISREAAKVAGISRNGYEQMGMDWGEAYRKGKVTSKDSSDVKRAAKETRKYISDKYGKEVARALAKSDMLFKPIEDFDASATSAGKEIVSKILNKSFVDPNPRKTPRGINPGPYKLPGPVMSDGSDDYKNHKRPKNVLY